MTLEYSYFGNRINYKDSFTDSFFNYDENGWYHNINNPDYASFDSKRHHIVVKTYSLHDDDSLKLEWMNKIKNI